MGSKFHSANAFVHPIVLSSFDAAQENSCGGGRSVVNCASINFLKMGIKSDKTFEEIVERLVALFHGQHEDGVAEAGAPRSQRSSDSASSVPLQAPSEDDLAAS